MDLCELLGTELRRRRERNPRYSLRAFARRLGTQADRPFVQLFVSVPDVDECLARATALGARVIVPASTLPEGDVMAVMLDPSGLPIAVCTPKR